MDRLEAYVTRSEIEFLIETRVIRNVHLTILPCDSAVLFHHHCGIVINTRSTTLEQREHQYDSQFLGEGTELLCRWARYRLSKVAQCSLFRLAEINAVMKFLKHHQLRTLGCTVPDIRFQLRDIGSNVLSARLLHHSHFKNS